MIRRARTDLRLVILTPLLLLAFRDAGGAGEPPPAAEPGRRVAEGADLLRKMGTARTGRLETPLVLPTVTLFGPNAAGSSPEPPPQSTGQVSDPRETPTAGPVVDNDLICWSSNLFLNTADRPFDLGITGRTDLFTVCPAASFADRPFTFQPSGVSTGTDDGPMHCLSPFLAGPPLAAFTPRLGVGSTLPWQSVADWRAGHGGSDCSHLPDALGRAASCCGVREEIRSAFGKPWCPFAIAAVYDTPAVGLLTGEPPSDAGRSAALAGPLDPRPVSFVTGPLEPVALAARVPVTDVVYVPGGGRMADPAVFSDKATGLLLGFNWYLTSWMRTQFNWAHVRFPHPVRLGPGPDGFSVNRDAFGARLQIIF